jgi:hypothetical protein
MLNPVRTVAYAVFTALLLSCSDGPSKDSFAPLPKEVISMANNVSIKLGESAAAFTKRYPSAKLLRQPAGLDFYSIDWNKRPRGTVTVEHGKHTIAINDALGISTSEDQAELKSEGFFSYTIYSGVSDPDLIPHDEARLKIHAILRRIMDAGWKQVISRSRPRLSGQARLDYVLNVSSSIGLDPNHLPSFDEWMRIENRTSWSFYADSAFLSVTFTREPSLLDPKKPGSYLLTFNLKTAAEYFRSFVDSDDRLRWKEVLPKELPKLAAARESKEAELRAKGIKIDESYQDPPLPAFK